MASLNSLTASAKVRKGLRDEARIATKRLPQRNPVQETTANIRPMDVLYAEDMLKTILEKGVPENYRDFVRRRNFDLNTKKVFVLLTALEYELPLRTPDLYEAEVKVLGGAFTQLLPDSGVEFISTKPEKPAEFSENTLGDSLLEAAGRVHENTGPVKSIIEDVGTKAVSNRLFYELATKAEEAPPAPGKVAEFYNPRNDPDSTLEEPVLRKKPRVGKPFGSDL